MDDDKTTFEKISEAAKTAAETVVAGARAIVSPTSETPIDMPHNESKADIAKAAKTGKRPARAPAHVPPERQPAVKRKRTQVTKSSPRKESAAGKAKKSAVKKAKKKPARR